MSRSPASRAGYLLGVSPVVLTALVASVVGAVAIEWLRARRRAAGDQALALVFYTGIAGGVVLDLARRRAERRTSSLPLRLDPHRDARRPRRDRGARRRRPGCDRPALPRALVAVVLDEEGARVAGVPVGALNVALAVLAALTIAALDAGRRHPADRRADGAAGDRRRRGSPGACARRMLLAIGDRPRVACSPGSRSRTTPTCRRAGRSSCWRRRPFLVASGTEALRTRWTSVRT